MRMATMAEQQRRERIERVTAGRVTRAARLGVRSLDAAHNELAVDVAGEDGGTPVVLIGQGDFARAWYGEGHRA